MRKLRRFIIALALLLTGFGASRLYSFVIFDIPSINLTPSGTLQDAAWRVVENYDRKPFTGIYQPGEQEQNRFDALIAISYIQVRQNQEVIRLLNDLKNKK